MNIEKHIDFLRQCMNNDVFPVHVSQFSEQKFYLKNFKAKHNMKNLLNSTKRKILKIEKFDLHRQLVETKRKINELGRMLSDLLPVYIWRDVFDKSNSWFEEYKRKGHINNNKKMSWLVRKENNKKVSNIKNINYQVYFNNTKKEFLYNKIENELQNDIIEIPSKVNISPKNFAPLAVDSLMQTNHRWFINLSSFNIPGEVSNLLQLDEGFSIPVFKNKKELVIEFIKDMEGKDLRRNNDQKLLIKNTVINKL